MNKFKPYYFSLLLIIGVLPHSFSQYTHADSLKGNYGNARNWWDLNHYELSVSFDLQNRQIAGKNTIRFTIDKQKHNPKSELQIDLQEPMILDSILEKGNTKKLAIRKDGNAYFVQNCKQEEITVYFHGKPKIARMPPWDGGIIWTKDKQGKPWVSIACQGLGASCWFPCKESQADEPDSVRMHFTCPSELICVSNGQFQQKKLNNDQTATYTWNVSNPINNYCMIPYIGDYVNMHEHFYGEKGLLEMDYWVLQGNEEKAKKQFQDAPRTIKALEHWFGPYPFYEDGYKLVEAPYLGMEHQSAVAYGNEFKNGYLGEDLSGTGIGLKWDFIIVHESGHEWFGNNITSKDIADMWIHEGFTCYSETLFTDFWFGKESGDAYCRGLRVNIDDDKPIIGPYGVAQEGSGDMYYKGANMLHTIRTLVDNDSIFRNMLREMNRVFYHKTVTTQEIETFMSEKLKMDLTPIFNQYLREKMPPVLQLKKKKSFTKYRWYEPVDGFNMPLIVNGDKIPCDSKWRKISGTELKFNTNLYFLIIKKKTGKSLRLEIVN